MDLLTDAGVFLFPLALCSFLAVFITLERLFALRNARVIPARIIEALLSGQIDQIDKSVDSVVERIIAFYKEKDPDSESLKAFANLEINRMERGVFLLEVVVGVAPLLGLLGTVTGLTQVFGGFSADTGLPEPGAFIQGIALALNTTILGLAVAIPSLAAHAYLIRRVDALAARINVSVEALLQAKQASKSE